MRLGLTILELNVSPIEIPSDDETIAVGLAEGTLDPVQVARWLEELYACSQ